MTFQCPNCANWDYSSSFHLGEFLSNRHPDHPGSVGPFPMQKPFEMTMEGFIEAAHRFHVGVSSGDWTEAEGKLFLSLQGLNERFFIEALGRARRRGELLVGREAASGGAASVEACAHYAELLQEEQDHAARFNAYIPAAWTTPGLTLREYVDAIMHLLFLGVERSMWYYVEEWAKLSKKFAALKVAQAGLMEPIQSLQLEWMKVLPCFKRKSNVAENWLAYARLQRYAHDMVPTLVPDKAPYVEPTAPHPEWNGKVCEAWLRAYGFPYGGLAAEKQLRVHKIMDVDLEGRNRELVQGRGAGAAKVMRLLDAVHCLIARVMTSTVVEGTTVPDVDRHAKMFLDALEAVDMESRVHSGTVCPKWLSSGNLISCLNLSSRLDWVGPLRNLWEGDEKVQSHTTP